MTSRTSALKKRFVSVAHICETAYSDLNRITSHQSLQAISKSGFDPSEPLILNGLNRVLKPARLTTHESRSAAGFLLGLLHFLYSLYFLYFLCLLDLRVFSLSASSASQRWELLCGLPPFSVFSV